jgi:hypothetical protein
MSSVIPALERLRQEDQELQVSLSYTVSHCLKKRNRKVKEKKPLQIKYP